ARMPAATQPHGSRSSASSSKMVPVGLTELLSDPDGTTIPLPPARPPPGAVGAGRPVCNPSASYQVRQGSGGVGSRLQRNPSKTDICGKWRSEGDIPLRLTPAGYSRPG